MPKVSVIIPTRNRCSTLQRAIASVRCQSFKDYELIVVNDGSRDKTARYLSTLDAKNSITLNLDNNRGGGVARNEGIKRASGDYIAFLDDDDTWEPAKLEEQVTLMSAKSPGICHTGIKVYSSQETLLKYVFKRPRFSEGDKAIMYDNFIGTTSSVMVQKRLLDAAGGFDPELPALQDWDLYIRLFKKGGVLEGIDKPLVNYFFMDNAQNVSLNARNHLAAVRRMRTKYAGEPAYGLLKKALMMTTVKKSFKSWAFFKGIIKGYS